MDSIFNSLAWHDAELLSINIDRLDAGNNDIVALSIKWPNGKKELLVFIECYLLDAEMNFGVIAEESILEGACHS